MFVVYLRFLKSTKISAITLFPFIFLRKKEDYENKVLINHEKIHIKQQIELLILPFYVCYITEYFINFLKYHNKEKAYRNISFEKEAYQNENNLDYLKARSFWNFINYR